MKRILVVWEDKAFTQMALVVRRRMPARAPEDAMFPKVLFHTAAGNGKFAHYVGSTWTNVRGSGTPGDPGPIDHLVCVVDGDKLAQLLPKAVNRPDGSAPIGAWHQHAIDEWTSYLRASVDPSVDPLTVHGHVLRWSKESFALAGYDRPSAANCLGLDLAKPAVLAVLTACKPDPRTILAAEFSDHFRSPLRCLEQLRAESGVPGTTKNAPEVDDCIKALALAPDHLAVLCARVPDVDRIVDLLWLLAASTPPLQTAPSAPAKRPKRR